MSVSPYLDVFHPVLYHYHNNLYTKLLSNTTLYWRSYLLWRHVSAPIQWPILRPYTFLDHIKQWTAVANVYKLLFLLIPSSEDGSRSSFPNAIFVLQCWNMDLDHKRNIPVFNLHLSEISGFFKQLNRTVRHTLLGHVSATLAIYRWQYF
jgi:hypothetical protein